jgi:hypothetical protein
MLYTWSIGLLTFQLLFGTSLMFSAASNLLYVVRSGTVYVYNSYTNTSIPIETVNTIKDKDPDGYKVVSKDNFQKLDDNLKNKLIEVYGDDFMIISNKSD